MKSGTFKDSLLNGFGVISDPLNFASQKGIFKDDKLHGFGEAQMEDGSFYCGQFQNGVFNGLGTIRNHDTNYSFVGNFKCGIPDGFGVLKSNSVIIRGTFKMGKPCGNAIMSEKQFGVNTSSVGFLDSSNLLNGIGKITKNEMVQLGNFKDGKLSGLGITYKTTSKGFYFGEFNSGKYHGLGHLKSPNESLKGEFINGVPHGSVIHKVGGDKNTGQYSQGKMIMHGGIHSNDVMSKFSFDPESFKKFRDDNTSYIEKIIQEIDSKSKQFDASFRMLQLEHNNQFEAYYKEQIELDRDIGKLGESLSKMADGKYAEILNDVNEYFSTQHALRHGLVDSNNRPCDDLHFDLSEETATLMTEFSDINNLIDFEELKELDFEDFSHKKFTRRKPGLSRRNKLQSSMKAGFPSPQKPSKIIVNIEAKPEEVSMEDEIYDALLSLYLESIRNSNV